ncbi:hypothetical protein E3E23_04595 [Thermococcus sp. CX2]|uniref:hypothetical protein n=1 Tax=Thermococcus sp. CX2 TaxID=163006 RepID=UPI00143A476C|nr:hypothetical protein [Thermococcus sp. CX2]NJE85107.1 hypothetical protein [Thermococcus sp. CX2]
MKIKPLVFFFVILLVFTGILFLKTVPQKTNINLLDEDNLQLNCSLKTEPLFTPINAWVGWSIGQLKNGTVLKFADLPDYVPNVSLGSEKSTGILYGDDWPAEMGIRPKCIIAGSSTFFQNNGTAIGMYYPYPMPSGTPCKDVKRTNVLLPAGNIYFADYVIPTANSTWEIRENIPNGNWTDFLKSGGIRGIRKTRITGGCTCPIDVVMRQLDKDIKAKGFGEVPLWMTPKENDCFKPLSVKLYRKDDQYLYVEFARVKGMDLVRVLMIMGSEEVVKAYAEAFTAGSIED